MVGPIVSNPTTTICSLSCPSCSGRCQPAEFHAPEWIGLVTLVCCCTAGIGRLCTAGQWLWLRRRK
eukprot:6118151-Amphidinium_carterae.1